jgi:polyisoprenoid-binding protein YceI
MRATALASIALWAASFSAGQAQTMTLDATNSQVAYTVEALGLLPIRGVFQQFHGVTRRDPAHPASCQVDVTVQVTSLKMDDPVRRRQALQPDMLDAGRYPTMHFAGACGPSGIAGKLTMHGVSGPLTLALHPGRTRMVATATLRRQDYGVSGLPDLVGPRVVIALTTPLPGASGK